MATIRIGVIGAGVRGRKHLLAYRQCREVEVVAVCDINELVCATLCNDFAIAHAFAKPEVMCVSDLVDAVSICTPSPTHFELAMCALGRGIHVLCEKPIAQTLAECDQLIAAARAHNAILASICQSRFFERTKWLKLQIADKAFGEAVIARGSGWTIHVWDTLLDLLGPVFEVSADWLGSKRVDTDPFRAVARCTSGNLMTIEAWPIHLRKFDSHPNAIHIAGSKGICAFALWSERTNLEGVEPGYGQMLRQSLERHLAGRAAIARDVPEVPDFVSAIVCSGQPRIDGLAARQTIEFVSASYESAVRRDVVRLPLPASAPCYSEMIDRISD